MEADQLGQLKATAIHNLAATPLLWGLEKGLKSNNRRLCRVPAVTLWSSLAASKDSGPIVMMTHPLLAASFVEHIFAFDAVFLNLFVKYFKCISTSFWCIYAFVVPQTITGYALILRYFSLSIMTKLHPNPEVLADANPGSCIQKPRSTVSGAMSSPAPMTDAQLLQYQCPTIALFFPFLCSRFRSFAGTLLPD